MVLIRYVLGKYPLPDCGLSSPPLHIVFHRAEDFDFHAVQLSSSVFHGGACGVVSKSDHVFLVM